MEQEKLKKFNEELRALLTKYSVSLEIDQRIVVNQNKMEETTPEVIAEEVVAEEVIAEEVVA